MTLVVSEAAWIYAFVSVVGVAAGGSGSPIGFFTILGLLGLSVVTYSYIRWRQFEAFEIFYFGATVAGLALVYLIVAFSFDPGSFTPTWFAQLSDEYLPRGMAVRGSGGALLGLFLLFRGIQLSTVTYPEKSQNRSFRLGLFFIGLAAIMDMVMEEQLNVFVMVLIFFGAGLAGLNVGNLVTESSASAQAKTWPKAIASAVVGVLAIGLVFGFIQQGFLTFITSPVRFMFANAAKGILIIVGVPFVSGIELINRAMAGVFSREIDVSEFASQVGEIGEEEEVSEFVTTTFLGAGGTTTGGVGDLALLVETIVRYALVAVALFLVSLFLYIFLKKALRRLRRTEEEERESILGEMNFASDIGDLFADFLPNLKDLFSRGARKVFRLPDGPPGVVEALKLYYQMLTTAERNEVPRPQHQTPTEFRSGLRTVFLNELVEPATEAFNRANYGGIPSSDDEIAKMRSSFRVISSGETVEATQAGGADARYETVTASAPANPWENQERLQGEGRNWFGGTLGVVLACGGSILFALVVAIGFAIVISIFG